MMFAPDNLLDVLAAAGAAKITGGRFSLPARADQTTVLPAITTVQAESLIAELRDTDFSHLRLGPMDFLRGSGNMPTLDVRARQLLDKVLPTDIVDYAAAAAAPLRGAKARWDNISLRWETGHPSDRPAAHRWIGSRPHPRTSHPGRNTLALAVMVHVLPDSFRAPPLLVESAAELDRPDGWPFATRRHWFAPFTPLSFQIWRAIQQIGPGYAHPEDTGQWRESFPASNGQVWYLSAPTHLMLGRPDAFLAGSKVPLWV
jgi:hypothetical protein